MEDSTQSESGVRWAGLFGVLRNGFDEGIRARHANPYPTKSQPEKREECQMACQSWFEALLQRFSRADENVRCNTDYRQSNDEQNETIHHCRPPIGTYTCIPEVVEK